MPIRAIIIFVVGVVILAICFKDPIYDWFKGTFKNSNNDENVNDDKEKKE